MYLRECLVVTFMSELCTHTFEGKDTMHIANLTANAIGMPRRFTHLLAILVCILGAGFLTACQLVTPFEANAGEDFTVQVGASPTFDGCASVGEIVNYKWTIIKAPDGMADYDGKIIREIDANCSFILEASMLADEAGEWAIELEVSTASRNRSTDMVMVTVEP